MLARHLHRLRHVQRAASGIALLDLRLAREPVGDDQGVRCRVALVADLDELELLADLVEGPEQPVDAVPRIAVDALDPPTR